MGEQIQCTGSAIPAVRLVLDPQEDLFDGSKKLLAKGAIDVIVGVERQRRRVVPVAYGRCFGTGRSCRDDWCCAGIGRRDDSCGQKGCIDGGGEGEAQVSKGAAAEVGCEGHHGRVQELIHRVERGVHRIPVD